VLHFSATHYIAHIPTIFFAPSRTQNIRAFRAYSSFCLEIQMKIAGLISSLFLAQTIAAQALSPESISSLPCPQVTQAGVARQSWSANGAPYGAPLIEWGRQEFSLLRARIAECARQTGSDVRGLLAYMPRLEEMTKLQNGQSTAALERKQRDADLTAQREARSIEERQRSQAAYERLVQRRDQEAEAANSSNANERDLVAKVETFASQEELKSFCKDVWQSELPQNARVSVISNCKRRLGVMAIADQEQAEKRQAETSAKLLPDLIQKLKQMPDNGDTLQQLQNLKSDNHYRLPSLSYPDQNKYFQVIESRLGEISTKRLDAKCETVISKIAVPKEVRDAIIIDGLDGVSLTYFLCGPVLTTGSVSVVLKQDDTVDIKVRSFTLTFVRRRYLPERKIEVALNSPIQGGVNALVLTGAYNGTDQLAIGNPNFFVVNFYSQFTPQVDAFLSQAAN
jgi:hypothetical protein